MSGADWLLVAGWLLAGAGWSAFFANLGRVADLRWYVGLQREQQAAVVVANPEPEERAESLINEESIERLADDIQEEMGVDPKVAREEAQRMLLEAQRIGGGW